MFMSFILFLFKYSKNYDLSRYRPLPSLTVSIPHRYIKYGGER
jgi:hypothetical protein